MKSLQNKPNGDETSISKKVNFPKKLPDIKRFLLKANPESLYRYK